MIKIIPNLHPAIVHFPFAFTTAALAFTAIGTLFRNWPYAAQCLMTGRWMLWGAANCMQLPDSNLSGKTALPTNALEGYLP